MFVEALSNPSCEVADLTGLERELITERVNAGIAAARQSGTRFGRPPVDPKVIA